MKRRSERKHWDNFWKRERRLDEIYDNDGRIFDEAAGKIDVDGKLVMEVGAATARDSVLFAGAGAFAVALDYSAEALKLAGEAARERKVGLLLVCGDAEALPFRAEVFDLVFHQGVLEHFRDPMPLLRENARVLKRGGTVLVDVPQTYHIYTVIKKILIAFNAWFAGWETEFTPGNLLKLLSDAGFNSYGMYGRFFSPSLAYRIFREILIKTGVRLPLRPVIIPSLHRLRTVVRTTVEKSFLGPRLGCIVGVIARKRDAD